MKFRWAIQVMTRNSGALTIYCKNKEQAESNVQLFCQCLDSSYKSKVISFINSSGNSNYMRIDEVISVHTIDFEIVFGIHKQEYLLRKQIEREIDFLPNDQDDTDYKDR